MRVRSILATLVVGSTVAVAQPAEPPLEAPPPEPMPAPEPAPPPAPEPPPVTVTGPPGALPPINITITNNNTGNNSNTNSQTNEQTNTQTNTQANPQTNNQTTSVPVTVTTTVAPPAPVPLVVAPPSLTRPRHYELMRTEPVRTRWITLGLTGGHHEHGIRGSIDLLGRRSFTIGVAAALEGGERGEGDRKPSAAAIAYLAWTGKLGRFDIRAHVGAGVGTGDREGDRSGRDEVAARTITGETDPGEGERERHRVSPHAEAGLLLGLPLGRKLALIGGPIVTADRPRGEAGRSEGDREHGRDHDRGVAAKLLLGLRYRF